MLVVVAGSRFCDCCWLLVMEDCGGSSAAALSAGVAVQCTKALLCFALS